MLLVFSSRKILCGFLTSSLNFWGRSRKSLVWGGKFQGAPMFVCRWQVSIMSKTLFRSIERKFAMNVQMYILCILRQSLPKQ